MTQPIFAWYKVAGLLFGVSTPFPEQMDRILPSYVPFRQATPAAPEQRLFTLTTVPPATLEHVEVTQLLAQLPTTWAVGSWAVPPTASVSTSNTSKDTPGTASSPTALSRPSRPASVGKTSVVAKCSTPSP